MTRSLFDEITLDLIDEGLNNIINIIEKTAKSHNMKVQRSEVRKLIEVVNKIAIEKEG